MIIIADDISMPIKIVLRMDDNNIHKSKLHTPLVLYHILSIGGSHLNKICLFTGHYLRDALVWSSVRKFLFGL